MEFAELKVLIINIFIVFYPLICILGLFGNTFAFLVFSRKKFENTSFSVYFRFLAVSDTVAVLYSINNFLKYRFDSGINSLLPIICHLYGYLSDVGGTSSAWISVMIGLDRLLNIRYPRKFPIFNKKNFQVTICIAIIIICLCSGLPEPFYVTKFINSTIITYNPQLNRSISYYKNKCIWDDPSQIYSYYFIAYEVMVPFFFMVIFSTLSIKTIFDSRKKLNKPRHNHNRSITNDPKSNAPKKSAIKAKDFKFAITSIALNVTFLLFVFPTNFLDILVYFISFDFDLAYVVSETFYHLNFAVVFFINFFFNSIFKNEFLTMIGCKKPVSNSNGPNSRTRSTPIDENML